MKLVTFLRDGPARECLGVLLPGEGGILDAQAAHNRRYGGPHPSLGSMQELIEGSEAALSVLRKLLADHAPVDRVAGPWPGQLAAPLPRPIQMRDCLCFEGHLEGALRSLRRQSPSAPATNAFLEQFRMRPFWYKCNRFAVCGPDQTVTWPRYSTVMDYECEMAAVIGRQARDVRREDASAYIFGYTIFNDFSARDVQGAEMAALGPAKSKDFDNANALGPCIVTADEIDPNALRMSVRVNGELRSSGSSSGMYYKFEDLIAFISQSETLYPGEILGSGTVEGGCGLEQGRLLESGDVVELEIEGIGVLRNQVRASA